MAYNPYRVKGLGVLDGYLSDSDYLTTTGATVKRGDLYFNTTTEKFRYYDGTQWTDLTVRRNRAPVNLYSDASEAVIAVPSTHITVDGVATTTGDLVLLSQASPAGIYKVEPISTTWTLQTDELSDKTGSPAAGDLVWVESGTLYSNKSFVFDGTQWLMISPNAGTVTDSTLRWDGTTWIENLSILNTASGSIYAPDDNVADANPAQNISISGSNKTAGTGAGGDVNINGGTSAGGKAGSVVLNGRTIKINTTSATDPLTPNIRDFYYNTAIGRLKYWDGTQWLIVKTETLPVMTSLALVAATTADVFSLPKLTNENVIIKFSVKNGTNKDIGQMYITHDGTTNVSIVSNLTFIGATGVTFTAFIDGSNNLKLQYTTTAGAATLKYNMERWSD